MAKFNIIIVGAGITGLSMAIALRRKGHDVTVLERHSACQALGGPVGLSACATRVLIEYGLSDIMTKRAMEDLQGANFRRYDTGAVLASSNRKKIAEAYGFPSWVLARFRLQETLAEVATERGIKIKFNSPVLSIDQDRPAVILKDGVKMEADLIIGADVEGIRAVTRDAILGETTNPITHFTGYNIDIPRKLLKDDPELSHLLQQINAWMGPGQIVFASNMPDHGDKINLCFVTEEQAGQQGEWYTLGDLEKLKRTFAHFDVTLRKLLDLADPNDCYIWRLSQMPPLPNWVSKSGRVVLAGDSAHAMLPYVGMGASMCVEDSACLAECLERAESVRDIPKVLHAFEQIRKPRTEWFVERGGKMAAIWHLPDGADQEKRDKAWASTPLSLPDMTVWDGKHIDDPPVEPTVPFHPLISPWTLAFDIFSYTQRRLDQIMV